MYRRRLWAHIGPPAILIGTPGTGRHKGSLAPIIHINIHITAFISATTRRPFGYFGFCMESGLARAPAPLGCLGHRDDPVCSYV